MAVRQGPLHAAAGIANLSPHCLHALHCHLYHPLIKEQCPRVMAHNVDSRSPAPHRGPPVSSQPGDLKYSCSGPRPSTVGNRRSLDVMLRGSHAHVHSWWLQCMKWSSPSMPDWAMATCVTPWPDPGTPPHRTG